jgi:hypothetical protein
VLRLRIVLAGRCRWRDVIFLYFFLRLVEEKCWQRVLAELQLIGCWDLGRITLWKWSKWKRSEVEEDELLVVECWKESHERSHERACRWSMRVVDGE